jgi:hypothetical protein
LNKSYIILLFKICQQSGNTREIVHPDRRGLKYKMQIDCLLEGEINHNFQISALDVRLRAFSLRKRTQGGG